MGAFPHGQVRGSRLTRLQQSWSDLSYAQLAFRILSLYISVDEIPAADLKDIIDRSYSTFRADDITPLTHLRDNLHLLELFHGPSYSFKDCTCTSGALRNDADVFKAPCNFSAISLSISSSGRIKAKREQVSRTPSSPRSPKTDDVTDRHHLTVVGATSGDVTPPSSIPLPGRH